MDINKSALVKTGIDRLRQANRVIGIYTLGRWMSLPLSIAQLKSFFFIANEGSTNFKKLAGALRVTPSTVTGIVDHLVDQGLVSRQEDPEDRRMLSLRITPEGQTLLAELRESTESQISALLARMTDEDLTSLVNGLQALIKAHGSS